MGNSGTTHKAPRAGQNRFFIFLLIFAAISSAGKDLDRLYTMTQGVHGLASSWLQSGSTVTASEPATVDSNCPQARAQMETTDQLQLIAIRQPNEIGGLNFGIAAEPARAGVTEIGVTRKVRHSARPTVDVWVRSPEAEIASNTDRTDMTGALEFYRVRDVTGLDLPASLNNIIKVDTFRGNISSDFSFKVAGRIGRKHFSGFERELLLKTLRSVHIKELAKSSTIPVLINHAECVPSTDELDEADSTIN